MRDQIHSSSQFLFDHEEPGTKLIMMCGVAKIQLIFVRGLFPRPKQLAWILQAILTGSWNETSIPVGDSVGLAFSTARS